MLTGLLEFAVSFFIIFPIISAYNGLVLMKLWDWFITPTFSVVSPNLFICMGLFGLAGLFRYKPKKEEYSFEQDLQNILNRAIALSGALLIGYLLHLLAQ